MDAFGTYGGGGGWPTKSPDSPPDPPLQSIHGDVQNSPICARFFPFTQNLDCKQSYFSLQSYCRRKTEARERPGAINEGVRLRRKNKRLLTLLFCLGKTKLSREFNKPIKHVFSRLEPVPHCNVTSSSLPRILHL